MPKTKEKKNFKERAPYTGPNKALKRDVKPKKIEATAFPSHPFSKVINEKRRIVHPYYFAFKIYNTPEKDPNSQYAKTIARKHNSQIENSASILKGLSAALTPLQESDDDCTSHEQTPQSHFEAEQQEQNDNENMAAESPYQINQPMPIAPIHSEIQNIARQLQPHQQVNFLNTYRALASGTSPIPTESEILASASSLNHQQQLTFFTVYNQLLTSQYNRLAREIQNENAPSISNNWSTIFTHQSNVQNVMVTNTIILDSYKPT